MDTIHIATTIDTKFIQHLGVTLCSLFENNKTNHFTIHIIVDFENNEDFLKLKKLVTGYGHTLNVIKIDGKEVDTLKIVEHFSRAIYFRLSLPDFIDPQIVKILYIDSDIIIRKDISDLWNIDVTSYAVAAVQEAIFKRYTQLGFSERTLYFNSGVMLINLAYWRSNNIKDKVLNFIKNNPELLAYPDQDGLNVILQEKWLELNPIWNVQTLFFYEKKAANKIHKDQLSESTKNPAIVHFTGRLKPWHYYSEHPYSHEYYRYRALTDWRNTKLSQNKVQNILKQSIKHLLNILYGKKKFPIYKRSTHI